MFDTCKQCRFLPNWVHFDLACKCGYKADATLKNNEEQFISMSLYSLRSPNKRKSYMMNIVAHVSKFG